MATTGRILPAASPAAKVTACCSAIPTSKYLSGKRWWISCVFLDGTCRNIICARTMPLCRVFFRKLPAFALLCDDLNHYRSFNLFDILKNIQHEWQIMSIKRAKKLESKFFKNHAALAM